MSRDFSFTSVTRQQHLAPRALALRTWDHLLTQLDQLAALDIGDY